MRFTTPRQTTRSSYRALCALMGALIVGAACAPVPNKGATGAPALVNVPPKAQGSKAVPAGDSAETQAMSALIAEPSQAWYGLYMLEKKVGHAQMWSRATRDGEPGALVFGTDALLRIQGPTQAQSVGLSERRFYGAEPPHHLVATELIERSQGIEALRRAKRRGERFEVTVGDEAERPRDLPASAETIRSVLIMAPRELQAVALGEAKEVSVFDWESLADEGVVVTPKGHATLLKAGVKTPVLELEVVYKASGLKARSMVGSGGVALRTTLGAGLTLKLEEEEVAKAQVVGLDVLASGVPVARRLKAPEEFERLDLEVRILEGGSLPEGAGQRVTRLSGERMKVVLSMEPGPLVDAAERKKALSPHGPIDSDHPAIEAQALALTAGLGSQKEKAQALVKWVYSALKKELATHIPSASKVLERRVGDCTEHTWLFVALARAAGIPARPVYGLMYIDGTEPSFGYHAWAEVELDGRWVALDPTWEQLPADATHLRLGRDALGVAKVMGAISISVPGEGAQRGSK